jgi:hypothetical protein
MRVAVLMEAAGTVTDTTLIMTARRLTTAGVTTAEVPAETAVVEMAAAVVVTAAADIELRAQIQRFSD